MLLKVSHTQMKTVVLLPMTTVEIGKRIKMNRKKVNEEIAERIGDIIASTLAKKVVKEQLGHIKIREGMTKREVKDVIQEIGEAYSAVFTSTIKAINKGMQGPINSGYVLMDEINKELGIEVDIYDEDDEDDEDEEDED